MVLIRGAIFFVILLTILTSLISLPAFSWLVKNIVPALLFAIPVIFAPEIRRGLERLGRAAPDIGLPDSQWQRMLLSSRLCMQSSQQRPGSQPGSMERLL